MVVVWHVGKLLAEFQVPMGLGSYRRYCQKYQAARKAAGSSFHFSIAPTALHRLTLQLIPHYFRSLSISL